MSKLINLNGLTHTVSTIKNWVMSRLKEQEPYVSITYQELKDLRDESQLVPGRQYRITDYMTTTIQSRTRIAGHQFDIIVTADDVNVLNENARAIQHTTDENDYFLNSDLNAWELKYCLDNERGRFAWIDPNGKGVIYYMKDEWNNECPYDFKNIQFARWELSDPLVYWIEYTSSGSNRLTDSNVSYAYGSLRKGLYGFYNSGKTFQYGYNGRYNYYLYEVEYTKSSSPTYCYTFGNGTDYSMDGSNRDNVIKEYNNGNQQLNNIVFLGNDCYNNTFGNYCHDNTFGNSCYNNTFGNSCYFNSFGNYCQSNSFGNSCYDNTFGNYCYDNSFGNSCSNNIFGESCYSNTFGDKCYNNTFGYSCESNSFGNNCGYNILGNDGISNTFGNNCTNNSFRRDGNGISLVRNRCKYNHFGDNISNLTIYNTSTSTTGVLQNIYVNNWFSPTYSLVEVRVLDSIYKITLSYNKTSTYNSINVDYGSKQWRHVTARATIYCTDKYIVLDNTSNITITLPEPWDGAEFYFYKRSSTSYSVSYDGGTNYISDGHQSSNSEIRQTKITATSLGESKIVWDPSANEWLRSYMG